MDYIKLRDFVSDTIEEIAKGIEDAIENMREMDVLINPMLNESGNASEKGRTANRSVQQIYFDLSVTTTCNSEKEKGFNINVVDFFSFNNANDAKIIQAEANRVRFAIPVGFQTNTDKSRADIERAEIRIRSI